MTAYYNEIDPYAAEWLRNLIAAGHIAPGDVDERDIRDVRPDDLAGYTQCHFFAGTGVWSYSLRLAGWPDDRPVWTGSCPCPPFSAAGKGSECPSCGGKSCLSHPLVTAGWVCLDCGDEWHGDDRHLLPEFIRLIGECGPSTTFGEQVASRDGRLWLYTLRSVMETLGHAFGAADTCSAGSGAPHIRQRLRFGAQRLEHAPVDGRIERRPEPIERGVERGRGAGGLADDDDPRLEGRREPGRERAAERASRSNGLAGGMADAQCDRRHRRGEIGEAGRSKLADSGVGDRRPGPTNGFWRDADWLFCRDGKWRPVEPGTFPLAHGASARVGRLRAYGNAVDAQATKHFVEAWMEAAL